MATKTKAPTSRKKKPKASAKPAGSATSAGATAAPSRRGRKSVAFDIRNLVTEVRDLRTLRTKYNSLMQEHHGLLGTLKDLSAELGTSARKAWGNYSYKGDKGAKGAAVTGTYRTRVRTSSELVDTQFDKLVAVIPTAWTSKNDICKAAGLNPKDANTAFRRLVTGFKRDGKNHPARLESNGKRGTEGRYRKA